MKAKPRSVRSRPIYNHVRFWRRKVPCHEARDFWAPSGAGLGCHVAEHLHECLRINAKGVVCRLAATHKDRVASMRAKLIHRASHHFILFKASRFDNPPASLAVLSIELAHFSHQWKKHLV